jgi:chemotaxis protein histidine kinase CheA/CheY-like chemotaxis protein
LSRAFRPDDELKRELMSLFASESRDELDALSSGLVALESGGPESGPTLNEMMRAAHSLKGGARAVELEPVDRVAHALEDLLKSSTATEVLASEAVDLAYRALDAIEVIIAAATGGPAADVNVSALCEELREAATGSTGQEGDRPPSSPTEGTASGPAAPPAPVSSEPSSGTRASAPEPTVRVKVSKLDRLMASVRELETARVGIEYATEQLTERAEREDIETREYDRRAGAIRDVTSGAMSGLQRAAREVADDVAEVRTVPLSLAFDPLPRTVRDLARDLGKKVGLEVSGGEIDVDRSVMEVLRPALVHVIRNAVDHGIESPPMRFASGKPEEGRITVRARSTGGRLEVEVSDDGSGLDEEAIRTKAVAAGLVSEQEADAMPYEEIVSLVLMPGFSTREKAGEISGRGVGLDAVQEGISSIQGGLEIGGIRGSGTRVMMSVPLAIAAIEVIVATIGGHAVGFPLTETDRIVEIEDEHGDSVDHGSATIPLSNPATVESLAPGGAGTPRYAVIVRAAGRRIAVPVESLIGVARLSTMPLPEALPRIELFRSVAILPDGRVLRLLEPQVLITDLPPAPRLLVVDDSVAWQERARAWFGDAGWEVETAPDGQSALAMLTEGRFDGVLTDVEMPRLDGIGLAKAVRSGSPDPGLPIVVWTASAGEEAGPAAEEAGVDAFLAKEAGREQEALSALRAAIERRSET